MHPLAQYVEFELELHVLDGCTLERVLELLNEWLIDDDELKDEDEDDDSRELELDSSEDVDDETGVAIDEEELR